MVGREEEVKELQERLSEASEGQGRIVLIAGEAGVGKTKLVNELKEVAVSKGFAVMVGNSIYESLTPYMPIVEALRSGGLETLFAGEAPRIEGLYLITPKGLLAKEVLREKTGLDPDLFSSMLSTVGDFVRDSLSMMTGEEREGALNTLGYENYRIIISSGMSANLVAFVSGRENEFLVNDLDGVLSEVHREFGSILEGWDGDTDKLEGLENLMKPLITSGKYDGIYYGTDNPEGRRNLLFENVSLGLMRQARTKPTLLCIEDLHWADPSSLAMMHYVARNTRKCSLLMLGTFRPEDIGDREGKPHPLVETMQLMSREDLYERMELSRLPRECMSDFLSALLGEVDVSDEFEDHVYRETEGNPLFMLELVKLLVDEGAISPQDGTWRLVKDLRTVDVPTKIHDVITRRLDRVKQEQRKVLDYASVIGEVFTSVILSEVLRMDRIDLLEQLRALQKTHRLIHPFNGCFRFDHAKIKEVLYEETPEELRTEYHAMIADAIERQNEDDLDEVVEDLAFQYSRSGNTDKAFRYLREAAAKAKSEYSNEEAIRFYREALRFVEDRKMHMEVFVNLGDIFFLVGHLEKSLESYKNALELAEETKDKADIEVKIGKSLAGKGDFIEAERICEGILNLDESNFGKEISGALTVIGGIHRIRGRYEKALALLRKSLEIYEKMDDQEGVAFALNNLGLAELGRGEYEMALDHIGRGLEILEEMGNPHTISTCLGNLAQATAMSGDYPEALGLLERSLRIREKIGDLSGVSNCLNNMAVMFEDLGEFDKAIDHYGRCLDIGESTGNEWMIALSHLNLGCSRLLKEEYDKALLEFEKGRRIFEKPGYVKYQIWTYCGAAEAHLRLGSFSEALKYCDRALELANKSGLKEHIGIARRILGIINCEQRKWKESVENFQASIENLQELNRLVELGKSHYEFALMWKERGDVDKARTSLDKALDIFIKMKLESWTKKAKDVSASLEQTQT